MEQEPWREVPELVKSQELGKRNQAICTGNSQNKSCDCMGRVTVGKQGGCVGTGLHRTPPGVARLPIQEHTFVTYDRPCDMRPFFCSSRLWAHTMLTEHLYEGSTPSRFSGLTMMVHGYPSVSVGFISLAAHKSQTDVATVHVAMASEVSSFDCNCSVGPAESLFEFKQAHIIGVSHEKA